MKRIVYIAHKIGDNPELNLKDLARIIRKINMLHTDVIAVAPYYADIVAMDDSKWDERKIGMDKNFELIQRGIFDEIWLVGDWISDGMKEEVKMFTLQGKPVINMLGIL